MAELFKFRCSQCEKLLGVSPRKVGRPVSCPKCGVELIVPGPESAEPDDLADSSDQPSEFAELGIDLGLSSPLALRPVDRGSSRGATSRTIDAAEAIEFLEQVAATPELPDPVVPSSVASESPTPSEADDADEEPEPLVQTPIEPLSPRAVKPKAERTAIDRRRDVILPRTAVVAWSLFAILALGLSFVAGLMIGHYRWR